MNFKKMHIMKKGTFLLLTIGSLFTIASCSTKTTNTYYNYETTCLGVEGDGSQTVVAWGQGRNATDAVEQAKKNAVSDIIFKGIRSGSPECNTRPLVNEVNARERYEEYFNIFFMDGGEYKKYISMADEKNRSRSTEKYQYGQKKSVTVRVLRSELKNRLKNDGIIPKDAY